MARMADTSGLLPSSSQPDSPQCGVALSKRFKKILQDIQVATRYLCMCVGGCVCVYEYTVATLKLPV